MTGISIPTIEFGVSGNKVRVPRVGLGCMSISEIYGRSDDNESVKVLNRALDEGCNFFDTADVYGLGHNERLISRVLKSRRNETFICTKFSATFNEPETDHEPGNRPDMVTMITGVCGTPEYVKKAVQDSLRRLGIDKIDLYYQHRPDPNVPIEETVEAMADLVKEGKVSYLGLSECDAETLRRAYKVHPIAAYQAEYSAWHTDIERNGILDTCRDLGVTVVAYSPLGRGFLTGQIRTVDDLPKEDWRTGFPRFQEEVFNQNIKLVRALEEIAKKKDITTSQLALAWVLAQDPNIIVIPGTKHEKYLLQNIAAGDIVLTDDDLKQIRHFIDTLKVIGDRFHKYSYRPS